MRELGLGARNPLAAGPLIAPTAAADMADALVRLYGARDVQFGDDERPIAGLANRVELEHVVLHYCRYDVPVSIAFPRLDGFRQFFCLSGSGRLSEAGRELETTQARTGIAPPGARFRAHYGAGYSHIVVQLQEDALRAKLEQLCEGAGAPLPPVYESLSVHGSAVRDLSVCLARQFDGVRPASPLLIQELQEALITAFLLDHRRPGAAELSGPTTAELQRLKDYMHAHWDRPLTVQAVAAACGMSPRTVFAHFKAGDGRSPLAYMRDLRLDAARGLLIAPDRPYSVLDVAIRCGFSSFGHFARRYRERFGELPSETLARRS